jgi:VIT1/CCC1 family predicted Fe2+/Mn2+ transporter
MFRSSANSGSMRLKPLITTRSWRASGLEMTIVGVIEAAVTYGLGVAFGAIA